MANIIDQLNWRYATKLFDPTKKVSDQDFETILESLRLTASSFGTQPWKFVVVKNPDIREQLKKASWDQPQMTDASHLIVLCRINEITPAYIDKYVADKAKDLNEPIENSKGAKDMMIGFLNGKSTEEKTVWLRNQVYIALGNLLTTCASLNIDACPMEGLDAAKFDEILGLEKYGINTVVACPIGYRSENDKYATRKKFRFPKAELVIEV